MDSTTLLWWDFRYYFLPAAHALAAGYDPYEMVGYLQPPWLLYPILPLLPLPQRWAALGWTVINLAALIWALELAADHYAIKWGKRRAVYLLLLVCSPFPLFALYMGQRTPLILLGLVGAYTWRRSWLSPLLLALKPQLGLLGFLSWLRREISAQRWRQIGLAALAAGIAALPLFVVAVDWPINWFRNLVSGRYLSGSPETVIGVGPLVDRLGWPFFVSMLVAASVLVLTMRRQDLAFVASASLLFSLYGRVYDYVFILPSALYLFARPRFFWPALALLAFPIVRFLAFGWERVWLDLAVPLGMILLLMFEKRP